ATGSALEATGSALEATGSALVMKSSALEATGSALDPRDAQQAQGEATQSMTKTREVSARQGQWMCGRERATPTPQPPSLHAVEGIGPWGLSKNNLRTAAGLEGQLLRRSASP